MKNQDHAKICQQPEGIPHVLSVIHIELWSMHTENEHDHHIQDNHARVAKQILCKKTKFTFLGVFQKIFSRPHNDA